jgi:hypothetical protein
MRRVSKIFPNIRRAWHYITDGPNGDRRGEGAIAHVVMDRGEDVCGKFSLPKGIAHIVVFCGCLRCRFSSSMKEGV